MLHDDAVLEKEYKYGPEKTTNSNRSKISMQPSVQDFSIQSSNLSREDIQHAQQIELPNSISSESIELGLDKIGQNQCSPYWCQILLSAAGISVIIIWLVCNR